MVWDDLAQAGDDGSPGGAFRKHFTALAMAGGKGDLPAAQAHVQKALAITTQEKWPTLEVAVHMAMAATQLGVKDMPGAYATYAEAEKAAQAATAAQDPAGVKLEVQALAGKGSTRITQKTRQNQARPIKAYIDKLMPGWEEKIQRRAEAA
jgi:hypothetical protein